jgi:hypothetical protein
MLRVGIKDPTVMFRLLLLIVHWRITSSLKPIQNSDSLYISTSDWIVQMEHCSFHLGELGELMAIEILESAINSGTELLIVSAIGASR